LPLPRLTKYNRAVWHQHDYYHRMKLIPTILCGGAGSRLWPVSRELHPKPFIRLADGQSLLQKAWLRGVTLPDVAETLTVTNRELVFKTEDEYREVAGTRYKDLPNSFILEPFGRNTAPAVAVAALQVAASHGDDALLLVLAADHLITDQPAFAHAVAKAMSLAAQGMLVTFGIQPETPETGYGYIEADGNKVVRFVEKPSLETAREYLESGKYLWNSGMFCFSAGAMLREMQLHCPEILAASRACLEQSRRVQGKGHVQIELEPETFGRVPDDSIDYAVMEKSRKVAVVPCNIGWSDIGSWNAVGELTAPDAHGNRIAGEVMLHDVSNCYIQGNQRIVGAIGVDNLIVIDTPDAVLVADRSRAQDVKLLFARLKAEGHETHRLHTTVHRPWGTYTVLEEGPRFKIKRIVVKPEGRLSLQMHHHRSEHWVVVSGMARVVNGEQELFINTDESTYIPAGHKHRLENPGVVDLVMIEVQSGEYLGEDDIVRFEDIYGR
jgi:mannose-1-phosphate guanylyltransferase/mannose-6-phosphate isomerase